MRCEVNYAEFQRYIDDGTISLDACRRMGSTHKAYGWSCTPHGHWNEAQKQAYRDGYHNAL
jgi:hypothetical protein